MIVLQSAPQLSSETAISVGLFVVVVSAIWKLATTLADIRADLRTHAGTPAAIEAMGKTLVQVDGRLKFLEEDVNTLWATTRADDPEQFLEKMRRRPRGS